MDRAIEWIVGVLLYVGLGVVVLILYGVFLVRPLRMRDKRVSRGDQYSEDAGARLADDHKES